jgi:uncharacterized protein YbaR (Trm112 family)
MRFYRIALLIALATPSFSGTISAIQNRRYNGIAMISKDLLDMLVCPLCKQPVVLNANGQSLKCGQCRRVYPIQDDIPIMLLDAAAIDPV